METASARELTDWKKDLKDPPRKYQFLLNGKPYKGAFNKKYVGKQVLYYTGVKPNRYSSQLEYRAKGFIVEDEPVVTAMDKWISQERKFDPLIREIPIYDQGQNALADEGQSRPIVGYQLVKNDPNTGQRNVLATYYDQQMRQLKPETPVPDLLKYSTLLDTSLNRLTTSIETLTDTYTLGYQPYENRTPEPEMVAPAAPRPPTPLPEEPPYETIPTPPQRPRGRPNKTIVDMDFIDNNASTIQRFIDLMYQNEGVQKRRDIAYRIHRNYRLTLVSVESKLKDKTLKIPK
jgi:hypothetical protein